MPERVAALVLAAGRGSRFGGTKQLARLEGRPLVAHVVARAHAAGLAPVVVVVGHDADAVAAAVEDDAEIVVNPEPDRGQSASLRAGVRALESSAADADAMVVLLADEPRVSPSVVRAVVAALAGGADVARAVYDDRPGHPVGFARPVWSALLAVEGDRGARQVLAELDVVPVPVAGAAPTDVDTPGDLDELR